jgi:Uma2 family endonuclease
VEIAPLGLPFALRRGSTTTPRGIDWGVVTGADGVYKFPGAETGLIPDVGFYQAARLAQIVDEDRPIPFAPDLAVEVASPSQVHEDMTAKARVYLRAGTRLVWVIWPQSGHVDVWHQDAIAAPVAALTVGGTRRTTPNCQPRRTSSRRSSRRSV